MVLTAYWVPLVVNKLKALSGLFNPGLGYILRTVQTCNGLVLPSLSIALVLIQQT